MGSNPATVPANYWNPAIETMSWEQIQVLQWEKLKRQLVYNYTRSPFYRKVMDDIGLRPEDVRSWEDFQQIPTWNKEKHRELQTQSAEEYDDPYYLLGCAGRENFVRFTSTSGTTGVPTLYTATRNDVRVLNELFARKFRRVGLKPGDIAVHAKSLSMFTGGVPAAVALQEYGCGVVPVGADSGSRRILTFAKLAKANVLWCTPSLSEYLIEKCPEVLGCEIGALGIQYVLGGGEPGPGIPSLKEKIETAYGAKMFDNIGSSHPFHGISCHDGVYRGMHWVSPDYCILELLDLETRKPIPLTDGAIGIKVFTYLDWEGTPLMRYDVGDVLQVWTEPCECGHSGMRFKIIGRADDMLIVKGVNIYPAAIKNAILNFKPRTTGYFRIVLDSPGHRVTPPLQIEVEHGPDVSHADLPALEEELVRFVKDNHRVSPKVTWLEPGTIERASHKQKLIVYRQ